MKNAFAFRQKVRSHSIVSLPYTLNRKRIYIFPTRYGFLFLLILTSMLVGSVNYNNNLGFLLTFLLGSIMLVSLFYTYKNLALVKIISVRQKPVFAEERAKFEILVRAPHHTRSSVIFKFNNQEEVVKDIFLETENIIAVPSKTYKRGQLKPGPLKIVSHFPLSLFFAWSWLDADFSCTVYPKPISGPFNFQEGTLAEGNKENTGATGVDDFQGLKTYQPGDPLLRVSWKTFSRGQGLFTKVFQSQSGSSVLLDWKAFKDTNIERKLSTLCYCVLTADRKNMAFAMKLPGKLIQQGKGDPHKHKCLKELAMFNLGNNYPN